MRQINWTPTARPQIGIAGRRRGRGSAKGEGVQEGFGKEGGGHCGAWERRRRLGGRGGGKGEKLLHLDSHGDHPKSAATLGS